jgi:hypothetical protein
MRLVSLSFDPGEQGGAGRVFRDWLQDSDPTWGFTLLCARSQRPRGGDTADKYDEFPPRHGFALAKDYFGTQENITFSG